MGDHDLEERIRAISARDGRYPPAAYSFVNDALDHALRREGARPRRGEARAACNVSGRDLLDAAVELAVARWGALAGEVFLGWNFRRTDDIGAVVFALVDAELLRKTDSDSPADYHEVFDLREAFDRGFRRLLSAEPPALPARRTG